MIHICSTNRETFKFCNNPNISYHGNQTIQQSVILTKISIFKVNYLPFTKDYIDNSYLLKLPTSVYQYQNVTEIINGPIICYHGNQTNEAHFA